VDIGAALAVLGPGREAAAVAAARARALRALADDVRRVARRMSGTAEVDWRSSAAEAFRLQTSARSASVTGLAAQLDGAADALDRHATLVAARVAAVEETVRRAPERLRDLGGVLARRVADELEEVLP
jgi:hypothetical protein